MAISLYGVPFRSKSFPRMRGSPWNSSVHTLYVIMKTGWASGLVSSGVINRPSSSVHAQELIAAGALHGIGPLRGLAVVQPNGAPER